jgi:hypothetical protein
MYRSFIVLAATSCFAIGCGADPSLRKQMAEYQQETKMLETQVRSQHDQIQQLSADNLRLAASHLTRDVSQDATDATVAAWDFVVTRVKTTVKEVEDRARECYRNTDLSKFKGDIDGLKAVAEQCWNNSQSDDDK